MAIRGVLFDMIGTTVMEKDPSVVNRCFAQAFKLNGFETTEEVIKANRGKDKKEAIAEIAGEDVAASEYADLILDTFKSEFDKNLNNFYENSEARELINWLKGNGIVIGIGTGLPLILFQSIYNYLGWKDIAFDYIGVAEQVGKGRPHPAMIHDMLKKCSLEQTELIKLGDTVADVKEGKNAKVITVAILSGTQPAEDIFNEHPDYTIHSLLELKDIVNSLP